MTTQQIANRLVELCRKGDWKTVQNELFAKDAVSIEQLHHPDSKRKPGALMPSRKKGTRGKKWCRKCMD